MSLYVFLDTGPLGLLTHPHGSPENRACLVWLGGLLTEGATFVIPEVASYELRREYNLTSLRTGSSRALLNLNRFEEKLHYQPLNTVAVRKAAELWALVRKEGHTTAPKEALDGDALLVAQVATLRTLESSSRRVIATTNFGHLSWLAAHAGKIEIAHWRDITLTF